ncbi:MULTISPECIES: ABC transporter ATP-binding protein [Achromobacter]|nr:ABC transporter ATP-binding protein [Achromobacter kerstersii]
MATMNDTMIQLTDVSKAYGDVTVLDKVNLEVKRGEFLVLLGASGCGKSTLLNLMAGFITPNTGTVAINGKTVTDVTAACGMVFQQYALFPWRTVQENVEFGLKMRGMSKQERAPIARKFIEMVGLKQAADKYPHALSGGMKQRVSIARVLANDPDVMLFDEPFAALDAMTRQVLQDQLLSIYEQSGKTIVFITHSIDEALTLSTRMAVMGSKPGRIVQDIQNDLPHPRSADVQLSPRFVELKRSIWERVQEEVTRSMELTSD